MAKRKRRKRRKRPRRGKVGYVQPTDADAAWRAFDAGEADVLFQEMPDGSTVIATRGPDRERWAAEIVASFRAAGLAAEVVGLADLMGGDARDGTRWQS